MSRSLPDFRVTDHGTIWTFTPLTEEAIHHCAEMFPSDCPTMGPAFCVEHRFAPYILDCLRADGFGIL